MRIFLAHASGCSLPEIKAKANALRKTVERLSGSPALDLRGDAARGYLQTQVVAGRVDHQRNWRGDWNAWQSGVVSRRDATTGKLMYDAFVIERMQCGRATAGILTEALRHNRPVFYWDGTGMERVAEVQASDPDDWTNGWSIVREPKQMELDL